MTSLVDGIKVMKKTAAIRFAKRRKLLGERLANNCLLVVFSGEHNPKNGASYRPDSDFYYLTGFEEAGAIAVLYLNNNHLKFIMFIHTNDSSAARWFGPYEDQEFYSRELEADFVYPIENALEFLSPLVVTRNRIYSNRSFDTDNGFNSLLNRWFGIWLTKCQLELLSLESTVHELRLIKDDYEIKTLKKSAAITVDAGLKAALECNPGKYEYELEAQILYEFISSGARRPAFATIVASGENACILHYEKNNRQLSAGQLVLIDFGAEYEYYASDVSRTYPVNGKFTRQQQVIYEIVLNTQLTVIKQVKPGVSWSFLQQLAVIEITRGLIEFAVLKDLSLTEDQVSALVVSSFFPHRIGHWIGLEVHDVGSYQLGPGSRLLEAGMVITIEPGLYLPASKEISGVWAGLGVRIEDTILVTKTGGEVLTSALPKGVREIEKLMNQQARYKS